MAGLKVKVCGLTRARDVAEAVRAGADLVGFVLAKSARQISYVRLGQLVGAVPAQVQTVAVLVDPSEEEAHRALKVVDRIQLHGQEEPAFCARFGRRAIKALRIKDRESLRLASRYTEVVGGLLFDTYRPGQTGGTGEVFDWGLLEGDERFENSFLAGGLAVENVARAAQFAERVKLAGIDVSSGVESSPGQKDSRLIRRFLDLSKGECSDRKLQEV